MKERFNTEDTQEAPQKKREKHGPDAKRFRGDEAKCSAFNKLWSAVFAEILREPRNLWGSTGLV